MRYQPALPCHPHQLDGEAKMRGRQAFALLMAMRTGKTKTAIDDFGEMELAGEVRDLLVLAPAGVYRTWRDELEKHASRDLLQRARFHTWETGGGVGHRRALAEFGSILDARVPRVLLMNTEALSYTTTKAREVAADFVAQRRAEIIVDESTAIKGHKAERTKFVVGKLRTLASYRRILCGLPTPRDPLDLFGQFSFLDPNILGYGFREFTLFRARYAFVKKHWFEGARWPTEIVTGFKNLDELYAKIEPHSYRIRMEDIRDLPVTYQVRHVTPTPEQAKAYASLRRSAIAELEGGRLVTAQLVIVQMLKLHQILMGFVRDSDGVVRDLRESRTAALLELLEEYDGKAIIWVSYDYSVRRVAAALRKEYGERSVALFWGGNTREREAEDKRFVSDPECRFMVATPGSGGRGRRWDVADLVVYYSSTNNLEHRDQSQERAKDMTKTRNTSYVDLIAKGTVDEKIIKALRGKIDLAAVITGDSYREWLI